MPPHRQSCLWQMLGQEVGSNIRHTTRYTQCMANAEHTPQLGFLAPPGSAVPGGHTSPTQTGPAHNYGGGSFGRTTPQLESWGSLMRAAACEGREREHEAEAQESNEYLAMGGMLPHLHRSYGAVPANTHGRPARICISGRACSQKVQR